MDIRKAAQINTLTYFENDLNNWHASMEKILAFVNQAEMTGDPDEFTEARKEIAAVLQDMGYSREFITVKRTLEEVQVITADADALFSADPSARQYGAPASSHDLRGEGTG